MWTKEPGARSAQECATPPGHFTADGKTSKCPEGSYRADWKTAGQATACVACGEGVLALATDTVTKYARGGNKTLEVAVTSSAEDCCKCNHQHTWTVGSNLCDVLELA
jgi:hypothetical protein